MGKGLSTGKVAVLEAPRSQCGKDPQTLGLFAAASVIMLIQYTGNSVRDRVRYPYSSIL